MEKNINTFDAKRPSRKGKYLLIGGVVGLLAGLAIASVLMLSPKGWSKDVTFDDGRMVIKVQFKADPDPPTVGIQTLMARVKDVAGYPMRVDHVHFTVNNDGQVLAQELEGEAVGTFSATGDGFYRTNAELPSPGSYSVDLLVRHNQSSFNSGWTLDVK